MPPNADDPSDADTDSDAAVADIAALDGFDPDAIDEIWERTIDRKINDLYGDDDAARADNGDDAADDELEAVIERHAQSDLQKSLGLRITRTLVTSALEGRSTEEVRDLIDRRVIVGTTLSRTASWLLRKGASIVRDDWGDEKTEEAIMDYAAVAAPQTNAIDDAKLRDWIRLQLDWARIHILGTPPLKHGDVLLSPQQRAAMRAAQQRHARQHAHGQRQHHQPTQQHPRRRGGGAGGADDGRDGGAGRG